MMLRNFLFWFIGLPLCAVIVFIGFAVLVWASKHYPITTALVLLAGFASALAYFIGGPFGSREKL